MELSLILMSKMLAMMLWGAAGFALVKAGLLKTEDSRILSVLVIYLFCPSMLVRCFQIELTDERLFSLIAGTVFAFAVHFIWIALTRVLTPVLHLNPTNRASLIFTNSGNLILPLVSMILGDEYLFCTTSYLIAFNIMIWTYGVSLISGRRPGGLRHIFLNVNLLAIFAGLILLFTGLRLPGIIDTACEGFQEMVGPASMIVIGMIMGGTKLAEIFKTPRYYMLALCRLIILPLMILLLLRLSGIIGLYPFLREPFLISMLAVAAPPAALVTQIAVVWDGDAVSAGACNVLSTVFSLFSMPLIVLIYQTLFA